MTATHTTERAVIAKRVDSGTADTEEIRDLARAAGYAVEDIVTQTRTEDPAYHFGEGKVETIAQRVVAADATGAELDMVCGKGGYVRAIARDLGRALGCRGHVAWLRRSWSGPFRVEDGIGFEEVEALARSPELDARLLPLEAGLAGLPMLPVTEAAATRLRHGNPGEVLTGAEHGATCWAALHGQAVAVGTYRAGHLQPSKVFVR